MKLVNKRYLYLIILIVSIVMCFSLKDYNITLADDGVIHYLRVIGTVQAMQDNVNPPLIVPEFVNDLGYGVNLFYNPGVTYIPAILKIISSLSYAGVLKFFTFLTVFLSRNIYV